MKVTIWDLDYYYASERKNCKNPDVMKIASYHKQIGDKVNFVSKQDDIYRPYDLYYLIKEKQKTPLPPVDFFVNHRVRWWGAAFKLRVNWKMPDEMLMCRPDYLLYPELNTKTERSEYIRLLNNEGKLLRLSQDWTNTFKNKFAIVTDDNLWSADTSDLIDALLKLKSCKNISFLHPISIQKILSDKNIEDAFLKLKFVRGSTLQWTTITVNEFEGAWKLIEELKKRNAGLKFGGLTIDYMTTSQDHWKNKEVALHDFKIIRSIINYAKDNGFQLMIKMPTTRMETPYFFLFEELSYWTKKYIQRSWLEYITMRFGDINKYDMYEYWNNPGLWSELFKQMLQQTWHDREFLLKQWKGKSITEMSIAWKIWEKELEYGI